MRHFVELGDAFLIRHALRLQPRDQIAFRATHLLREDLARVLEDRFGQREHFHRVLGLLGIEQRDRIDQVERQRLVQREVALQLGRYTDDREASVDVVDALDQAGVAQRSEHCGRLPAQAALLGVGFVTLLDQIEEQPVATAAHLFVLAALQQCDEHPVRHAELRDERLGRTPRQPLEGSLVPCDEAGRRPGLAHLLLRAWLRRFCGDALVLDHVRGRLAQHPAAFVETLAARAAGDLLELAHRQQPHLLAVVFRERREEHRSDRHVHADAERVGAAHHAQQSLLRELLDQQPVLRKQACVMQPDTVTQQPLYVLAVRRVEAETREYLADRLTLLACRDMRRRQRLRLLRGLALREVNDIDGRPPVLHQRLDGVLQRRLAKLEVERHRPLVRVHVHDGTPGDALEPLFDRPRVAERCRHQQETRLRQRQQRHLPRDAALGVRVVVELVHHHVGRVGRFAVAQRHVHQHLGGAADHRRIPVDAGVAGEHADVLRAEFFAEREELLAGERLDRRRVERAAALAKRLVVEPEGDQRLARTGRRREHHVFARPQLEQCLFLRGVRRDAGVGDPRDEAVEHLVRGCRAVDAVAQARAIGG